MTSLFTPVLFPCLKDEISEYKNCSRFSSYWTDLRPANSRRKVQTDTLGKLHKNKTYAFMSLPKKSTWLHLSRPPQCVSKFSYFIIMRFPTWKRVQTFASTLPSLQYFPCPHYSAGKPGHRLHLCTRIWYNVYERRHYFRTAYDGLWTAFSNDRMLFRSFMCGR